MRKVLSFLILLLISAASLAASATVKSFYGKVKVKLEPGANWSKISVGQELPANALVSTGFNSQLVLDLGNATLDVLPLTRMKVEEITETQDQITTSLFLQGGKIKADVDKIEGQINDFKIKSPVATASVRGTSFTFSGNTLVVHEGIVAFGAPDRPKDEPKEEKPEEEEEKPEEKPEEVAKPEEPRPQGTIIAVKAGESSELVTFGGKPVDPKVLAKAKSSVVVSTKPEVIKDIIIETIEGPGKVRPAPKPGEIKKLIEGKVKIRIEFDPPSKEEE